MFKHLFATMNEVLETIIEEYPDAEGDRKKELEEQLAALRAMSDTCIEEWLLFEERMGVLYSSGATKEAFAAWSAAIQAAETGPMPPAGVKKPQAVSKGSAVDLEPPPPVDNEEFERGQGYYKLYMFDKASSVFEQLVKDKPDFLLARAYLAMSLLRSGHYAEAYRHFQLLLPLTDNGKIKAISLSAMGCIQAEQENYDKACEYFIKAYSTDPTCVDPVLQTLEWPRFP